MDIKVLEQRTKTVEVNDDFVLVTQDNGVHCLARGPQGIADDGPDQTSWAWKTSMTIKAAYPDGASIAMIGCGLCVLGQLHMLAPEFVFTTYEIEPGCEQFAKAVGASFVIGRWQDTLVGQFDVVVFDTAETLTDNGRATLAAAVKPSGMLLGVVA